MSRSRPMLGALYWRYRFLIALVSQCRPPHYSTEPAQNSAQAGEFQRLTSIETSNDR